MSAAEAVLLSRQPLSVLRPVVLFESFFCCFVFPSFFPSFFRTGLDLSSNKYQKLVLILVNTGQDNDKEWDELFFIVFFLSSSHCKFFLPLTRDYWYWSLGQSTSSRQNIWVYFQDLIYFKGVLSVRGPKLDCWSGRGPLPPPSSPPLNTASG